ncbi:uncharacterized protein V6R79_025319 [Siganus canaliculatus]
MRFPRDICRLLGLGGDVAGEEDMDVQNEAPDSADRRKDQGSSQATLSREGGLDDEQKARRRTVKRRAKRKRQKERKKQEREEKMEDAVEQEKEVLGVVSDSESEEELKLEEEEWVAVGPRNKFNPESVPALVTSKNKSNCGLRRGMSEEEPEWDISSAFVAKVASHIKFKPPKSRTTQVWRENKENESRSSQVDNSEEMKRRGEAFTVQGIQKLGQGQYSQAVHMFTEAINCDPKDHRFYGNRSYCYWFLEQYCSALTDARMYIQLAPDLPKGYFREGCALIGLKRYSEAEEALEHVLKLEPQCREASSKLFTCRVQHLMELGFEEEQSTVLLEKFTTVQAAVTSLESKTLKHRGQRDQSGSCCSLWVGNITLEVTEKHLWDLFQMFGEIESIRVLHERFCAFVNFKNANMAARALEKLQGVELGSSRLVMRYPDRWIQRTVPPIQRSFTSSTAPTQQRSAAARRCAPIDGDKCFYWQTTGCFYGDKCQFKHTPNQKGQDM